MSAPVEYTLGQRDLGYEDSIQRIRGPEGSTVDLQVVKRGMSDAVDVIVTRVRFHY